ILNVAAKDLATQKEAKITITASTKLAKEDIEKMTKDAELFSEQDKKKKEEVLIKNEAQQSIYGAETLISQQKEKISQDQGVQVSNAIKELKDVLDKSVEEIKPKLDSLTKLINDISTELYKNATPPPGAAAQGGPEASTQSGPDATGQDAGNAPN
ncbi:MAG TPA: Hsp70 family protein, partial [Candidatus Nitrosotalea sp.]|nr:Hsp70 family protein [Candidatus Nitrosotalea sp.]